MNKRFLLIYGLIGGLITVVGFFLWPVFAGDQDPFEWPYGQLLGYGFMLVALSTVFFGLRSYREKNGGALSFKEGFVNGMIVVFIASIIYVVGWMVYYPFFMPDFADQFLASQIELLKSQGLSEQEMQQQIDELKAFNENYKKPHVMVGFTFLEIFPVGIIITLVSALILKRKP